MEASFLSFYLSWYVVPLHVPSGCWAPKSVCVAVSEKKERDAFWNLHMTFLLVLHRTELSHLATLTLPGTENAAAIEGGHKPRCPLETRDKSGYWEKTNIVCHYVCDSVIFTHNILWFCTYCKVTNVGQRWDAISPWFFGNSTYVIMLNIKLPQCS